MSNDEVRRIEGIYFSLDEATLTCFLRVRTPGRERIKMEGGTGSEWSDGPRETYSYPGP